MTEAYEVDPVLDHVLAPFEGWADTGYAEGVVAFLPSLGREPLLLSPSSVAAVFQSAMAGLDPEKATDADKSEAARRFGFIERLLSELMTRENVIRDRYYAGRNRGMVHRTVVMLAGMALITSAAVTLPTWGLIAVGGLLACAGAVAYQRFRTKADSVRSTYLFEERAAWIIAALPWMEDPERISPRPPLEGKY
ncbi:hypothetical protein D3C71_188050 [compost metagenome]